MAFAEELYQKIPTPDKAFYVKNVAHRSFSNLTDEDFVDAID